MLRSASDSVPLWRARASVSACSGFSSSVTVLPTTAFWPSFSFGAWSIARTRTFDRMISELTISGAPLRSGFFSRFERITSTRSLGRMKPPAPVSGEISVETARMPVGRIAAMKPDPLALTSFGSRIGSPAINGARAIEPENLGRRIGAFVAADKAVARGRGRPGLPLQVLRRDRLAKADVGLRHQNVHGLQLARAEACCRTRSQDMRQCRRHRQRWSGRQCVRYSYASLSTLRRDASAAVMGVDQLFVKAWLMRRI